MNTFIDDVIATVTSKYGTVLRHTCIVFPTRRACLIFRKRLAATMEKPVWAPGILSIGDFMNRHSRIPVTEEIPLLVCLYDIYKKYWPDQDFGKYYAWGQMLLNDFDEIDKQLSDPSRVLAAISEMKKIDAAFLPDPESLTWISDFIKSFDEQKLTGLQASFTNTWNLLQSIYKEYNLLLDQKEMLYEGKTYRNINSNLKKGKFNSPWKHFVFAGFYGFSRAEEEMIRKLQALTDVTLMWDDDPFYVQHKNHEAGYYFRKSNLYAAGMKQEKSHFSSGKKEIMITGVPLRVGQAKYTGQLLESLLKQNSSDINSTAVILPDESMLFPVLYSIPESVETVNVTMGYPLQHSQYDELLRILNELYRTSLHNTSGQREFRKRNVLRLLRHSLFRNMVSFRDESITGSAFRLTAEDIYKYCNFKSSDLVFPDITGPESIFSYLDQLLVFIRNSQHWKKGAALPVEIRIIDYILSELRKLRDQLTDHFNSLTQEITWQMIRECITGLKVPFSGEPVKGLQVMGLLETRALDFETLIVLNVNEGVLPPAGGGKSFIPYSLRKAYGLSTYEDQEASAAYHFYRLLHRSRNIFLVYNSEVDKTNGGEPGRYLLQLKQELKKAFPDNISISENLVQTPVMTESIPEIIIQKDTAIREKLANFLAAGTAEPLRTFSSSAITSYIECSLRFYYRYIAGLVTEDEEESGIEAKIFGQILHKTLELLYDGITEPVTPNRIDTLLKKADETVDIAVRDIYKIPVPRLEGEDILLVGVIKELVRRILNSDKKDTPFRILGLEKAVSGTLKTGYGNTGLSGYIDRIDEKDAVVRIIDYKTGKIDLKKTELEKLLTDPKKKPLFQLYFYALLYGLNSPGIPVQTGFYLARNLGNGISWLENGKPVALDNLDKFRELLVEKINEIMNPDIPFAQTSDLKRCEYCDFKILCNR